MFSRLILHVYLLVLVAAVAFAPLVRGADNSAQKTVRQIEQSLRSRVVASSGAAPAHGGHHSSAADLIEGAMHR